MKEIRAKRRGLWQRAGKTLTPLGPLRDSVRGHPAAWAAGTVLVGAVAARTFGRRLARGGRRLAGTWFQSRMGDAVLGVALKALDAVRAEFAPSPAPHDDARRPGPAADVAAKAAPPPADPPPRSPAAAVDPQDPQAFSGL